MRNLLERLSVEGEKQLAEIRKSYPATVEVVMMELKEVTHIMDLRYGTLSTLKAHGLIEGIDITSLDKIFPIK